MWEINTLQHFTFLAQAFLFTKNKKYFDTIVRHLDSWVAQNPIENIINWGPKFEVAIRLYTLMWMEEMLCHIDENKYLFPRAVKMAEWEIDIQMKNGAVRGGVVGDGEPVPAVFCTGQVILGWVRAYKDTNDISFINAAEKAGNFLLEVQNEEGAFIEDKNYRYANRLATVYHTRVARSLILLGKITHNEQYIQAGLNNIEFDLGFQEKNGWFRNNCLADPEQPLLHTICYAVRGILEAGFLLCNKRFIEAAKLTADQLLLVFEKNGYLPGRLNKNWESSVHWSCLAGDAQLAIIWLKLYQETRNSNYLEGARKIIEFLKSTQNCSTSRPGLRGGIKGSYPFDGNYGRFEILNWATKFYVDALLLEALIQEDKNHLRYE